MKKYIFFGEEISEDSADIKNTIKKTILSVVVILVLIAGVFGIKLLYEKSVYQTVTLEDKIAKLKVVSFNIPAKWKYFGKVSYNVNSIPNLMTFFVGAINTEDFTEFQFFSTQFETDNGKYFKENETIPQITSEEYFKTIIKKLSPKAKNIKLEAKYVINEKRTKEAAENKKLFSLIYSFLNPTNPKGSSKLENYIATPVKYLFSYEENGRKFYQILEGDFVTFVQCFSNRPYDSGYIHTAIHFTKCKNIFSYKAEEKFFKKNLKKYEYFHKTLKINKEWEVCADNERRNKLADKSFTTTESLIGGDKFNKENFKNTIYYIEYLDSATEKRFRENYSKDLKTLIKKMFA